ncbi:helix-turn-helix domain-containing protein [Streptomyces sp. NPDC050738]|uniref:helix-turn-helix domain-containing protein n=1 Tax=Streptomyces sp. NPDC050738 TaxID=3154744 RepID=UPI0034262B1E
MTELPSPKERRRLREAKSLTEEQVATAVGVTRATVRSWETGRTTPRGRRLEQYAKLLQPEAAETTAETKAEVTAVAPAPEAAPAPAPARPHQSLSQHTRPRPAAKRAAKPPETSPSRHAHQTAVARVMAAAAAQPARPAQPARHAVQVSAAAETPDPEPQARAEAEAAAQDRKQGAAQTAAVQEPPAADGAPEAPEAPAGPVARTPAEAFDALYTRTAPSLVRQTYLFSGRMGLAEDSVAHAFHLAWQRWPEVATDRDPEGWVRAAAYEYAMSPWHRPRRAARHPDQAPADPERRALFDALLGLPPVYRRTLLLCDGVGLGVADTAAETEASTGAAANRLLHARAALAERLPELDEDADLRERLAALTEADPATKLPAARTARTGSERRTRFWTRAAIGFVAAITCATIFTLATAPTSYVKPTPTGAYVTGVPVPHGGPERLSKADQKVHQKLREEPANGPGHLVPDTR